MVDKVNPKPAPPARKVELWGVYCESANRWWTGSCGEVFNTPYRELAAVQAYVVSSQDVNTWKEKLITECLSTNSTSVPSN